jgi:hypothetical protein
MPLTDSIARNAKPAAKTIRIFDHDGLYLEVSPRVGKWWRLKYRYAGKEKRVSLGIYPEVNLKRDDEGIEKRGALETAHRALGNCGQVFRYAILPPAAPDAIPPAICAAPCAMARTILDEVLGFRPDLIEHQLAHAVRDPNGRAYNRTAYLQERRKMMQAWADYLDRLKNGADVLPILKAG